jgi:hypothetical protein
MRRNSVLRFKNQVRLSQKDKKAIKLLTGDIPNTNTVFGLNRHLESAKIIYSGDSAEEALIRHLIDKYKVDER